MNDERSILDYAMSRRPTPARPPKVAPHNLPIAYPVADPPMPLLAILFNFVVMPLFITAGLLGVLYFALIRH